MLLQKGCSEFQIRIVLENPQTENLRDTTVVATSLRRLSSTTAKGLVSYAALTPPCQQNGIEHNRAHEECDPKPKLLEILGNGSGPPPEISTKPPNELLLEMIGTRCLLTRLKVR